DAEAWNGGPNDSGVLGSATVMVNEDTLCVLGSRMGISSLEYSDEPKSGPYALTVGYRRSEETRSCVKCCGVAHSHEVTTTLRSTPCGRAGFVFGSSPFATRSVQSPTH